MGKLEEIRKRLAAGSTAQELVKQGYARSSVHHVAKKLKTIQPDTPGSSVPAEIQELRQQREKMKLQKEIADLEAGKEKESERVAALEKAIPELRSFVIRVAAGALWQSLVFDGMNLEEAQELSDDWLGRLYKWMDDQ